MWSCRLLYRAAARHVARRQWSYGGALVGEFGPPQIGLRPLSGLPNEEVRLRPRARGAKSAAGLLLLRAGGERGVPGRLAPAAFWTCTRRLPPRPFRTRPLTVPMSDA